MRHAAAKQAKTVAELAKAFQVHPVQISQWKEQRLDGVESLFRDARKREQEDGQAVQAELYEPIGSVRRDLPHVFSPDRRGRRDETGKARSSAPGLSPYFSSG
jgi:transposase-like protein